MGSVENSSVDNINKNNDLKDYWINKMAGSLVKSSFSYDFEKSYIEGMDKEEVLFKLPFEVCSKLIKISRGSDVNLHVLFTTVLNLLLFKITSNEDIIVGTPIYKQDTDGVFINTVLALRNNLTKDMTFKELLVSVRKTVFEAVENQNYPIEKLVYQLGMKKSDNGFALFDSIVLFENIQDRKHIKNIDVGTEFIFRRDDECIEGVVKYKPAYYNRNSIERVVEFYINALENALEDVNQNLIDIDIITEDEKQKLIYGFNNTKTYYKEGLLLHSLFEQQVNKTPDNVCLACGSSNITYDELNKKSNKLAKGLIEKGISSGSVAAIMLPPSVEMAVSILGVLKAGAAYLPIDSNYPSNRIDFMIKDSGAKILITTDENKPDIEKYERETLFIDKFEFSKENISNIDVDTKDTDLAYIIYTSGTTGRPKGVMVTHRGVVNTIKWRKDEYKLDSSDSVLQLFNYSFDGFITSFFTPLISGAKVVLLKSDEIKDPQYIERTIAAQNITHFICVPPLYAAVLDILTSEEASTLRIVTLAGDKVSASLLRMSQKKLPHVEVANEYGPTECSIAATIKRDANPKSCNVIGNPIANTKVYILDKHNKVQPVGIAGELCIAGRGLSKGYINREDITKEKFVKNPFLVEDESTFSLMYRTGDLARWTQDGMIEFLGRIDFQVKIRGFRIETEEIEKRIIEVQNIKECVVTAKVDGEMGSYLCAYIVADEKIDVHKVKEYLLQEIPEYMIPAFFIQLENLPLTPNGKIDRKALPDASKTIGSTTAYVAPKSEMEILLTEIWQQVLGVEKVGINDKFFDIGGDSIKAIQVSAKLQKHGLKMEMKDLFQNPTIEGLSKCINSIEDEIDQEPVEGEVRLIPIQKWFFSQDFLEKHHFNQSIMLSKEDKFNLEALKKTINKIVIHHDVLRMVYKNENGEIIQHNKGVKGNHFDIEVLDFTSDEDCEEKIRIEADNTQKSINLSEGPLVKLKLFKTKEAEHLLVVFHHLVVDGVSWRIIFEDFKEGYIKALNGEEIKLQRKTDSYKKWADKLWEYSSSKELISELDYWSNMEKADVLPLPKDVDADNVTMVESDSKSVSVTLSDEYTDKLLKKVNKAFNTEINDILLSTVAMSVKEWTGNDKVLINLEGHGREELFNDINITRTVGWFTNAYPLVIDATESEDFSILLKRVKEEIRNVPNKGIGYGVLKYLTPKMMLNGFEFRLHPQIGFNYLGQFDQDVDTEVFEVSDLPMGDMIAPTYRSGVSLDISGIIADGKLTLSIGFSEKEYKESTIEFLCEKIEKNLISLINYCAAKEETEYTLSDYIYNISIEDLDSIKGLLAKTIYKVAEGTDFINPVKNIYPLTPMQKGMLFYSKLRKDSEAYFEQTDIEVNLDVDLELVKHSFEHIIDRYDILRTIFVELHDEVLQVVLNKRLPEIYYQDITHLNENDQMDYVEDQKRKERQKGFDLSKDLLMRISLYKLNDAKYRIIWSFHHILMDGWCIGIIINEFFQIYNSLSDNQQVILDQTYSYSDYIKWFLSQDATRAASYWEKYVLNYDKPAVLPGKSNYVVKAEIKREEKCFNLSKNLTIGLENVAKSNNATMNTIVQAIWGVLLQKYNNTDDVIFGSVVSGRPPQVEGIEKMVGLFINTIPVRVKFDKSRTFADLLGYMQLTAVETEHYQYYPLYEIQASSKLRQDLLNNIFVFENYPLEKELEKSENESQADMDLSVLNVFEQTNYDFNIVIGPTEELSIKFIYNSNRYEDAVIKDLENHLKEIAKQVVKNPQIQLKDIEVLPKVKIDSILNSMDEQKASYPKNKTINCLFEDQVRKTPNNIALLLNNDTLTYKELKDKVDLLAVILRNSGVGADKIVGIMIERSMEMVVAALAVLKAGGAYLPIDPSYPSDRVKYMISDSGAKILLVTEKTDVKYADIDVKVLNIEELEFKDEDVESIGNINKPSDLAYVIYTSGTTGNPKGVMIEHKNVVRLLYNDKFQFEFSENDVWTMFHSFCFDFSVWEMYGALLYGGKLIVVPKIVAQDTKEFLELLEREKVTILNQTPTAFSNLLRVESEAGCDLSALRYVVFGGEALKPIVLKDFIEKYPKTKIVNMYGITETTVHVTYKEITKSDIDSNISNIGKPIPTLTAYIMDSDLKLLPNGVEGEICVGGEGVARGYLGKTELTKKKFVQNPYMEDERLYRSGDLAKMLPNGDMEYMGRIDQQVKIRGFRIETSEIESAVMKIPFVKDCSVIQKSDDGEKFLVAYIATDRKNLEIINGKRRYKLPNNMSIISLNNNETDFMYGEIFEEKNYIKYGIEVNDGDVVFDVGANIGMFSMFVKQLNKTANIYSFEPIPDVYEVLKENTALYSEGTKVFNFGLSRENKKAKFTYYPNASVMSGHYGDAESDRQLFRQTVIEGEGINLSEKGDLDEYIEKHLEERFEAKIVDCELKTLSNVIQKNDIEKIDLLKIDVEKSELDVLFGIEEEDFEKIGQIVIEVHDTEGQLQQIESILKKNRFEVFVDKADSLVDSGLYTLYAISENRALSESKKTVTDISYEDNILYPENIRNILSISLPEYMIPSYFVLIENMPLTSNGKVDRNKLPDYMDVLKNRNQFEEPSNEIEKALAKMWQQILGVQRVGINESFFELGGHSLKATTLTSKIHKILDTEVPLSEIFNNPTIKSLAEFIENANKDVFCSIQPVDKSQYPDGYYPLSPAQKRLYILDRMEGIGVSYNIPGALIIEGEISKEKIERCLKKIINRHEVFRTSFELINNEPMQYIHDDVEFEVHIMELVEVRKDQVDRIIKEKLDEFIKPFDLSKAPLLRVGLIKVSDRRHILMYDVHHIISDGTSMSILINEFISLYGERTLEPLKIQYKDYSVWQNSLIMSGEMEDMQNYWLDVFKGEIPSLDLPTDYKRPKIQSFEGDFVSFILNEELTAGLNKLSYSFGATKYMVLLAVFNVLLSKYSGQEDIIVGSSIAGRPHADLENVMGMFVNTLAMRNYPLSSKTFKEFLYEVKDNSLNAFQNQSYQFEELVEKLNLRRDFSRNALFDVMFVFQNIDMGSQDLEDSDLKVMPFDFDFNISKFDLQLTAGEDSNEIRFNFEYCVKLFKKDTIEKMGLHFINLLKEVLKNPDIKICDISFMDEEEEEYLLNYSDSNRANYPYSKTIHDLFEEQVERTPERIAVKCYEDVLTYGELNQKANQLARILMDNGLKKGDIAAIMVERSIQMITCIMAVLKAGGVYLPISPDYPDDRKEYMLSDSGAKILVTDNKESFEYESAGVVIVGLEDSKINKADSINLKNINKATDAAYVIYTSGTTGKPKGAVIEHRNVVSLLKNDNIEFEFSERDIWTMFHSFCFDFSVWEMFGALLYGGMLVVVPKIVAQDTREFLKLLIKEKVTVLNQTPTAFYRLIEEELKASQKELCLEYVVFGGEALKPQKLKAFKERYEDVSLINMYGITETTVHVTFKEISDADIENNISNIGKPISTLSTYIMDKDLKLVPIGAKGELCVGGHGVSRGYLNREELTGKKIVQNPYKPKEAIYRSGDLVRLLKNGDMEYIGRIDHQVKIRGFRIELSEIESVLLKNDNVKDAVVLDKDDANGNKYLCAYIVWNEELTIGSIKEYLSKELPDYMIPEAFIGLDSIPLTANGKVHRKALLEKEVSLMRSTTYKAPEDEIEKTMVDILENVLEVDSIGTEDDFFELGGNSLKATVVTSRIHKEFNVELPLSELFRTPTIKQLSEYIKTAERKIFTSITVAPLKDYYSLSSAQRRLYLIEKLSGGNLTYNMPIVLNVSGELDFENMEATFLKLVSRHETLRTSFVEVNGEPVQKIHDVLEFKIEYYEASEEKVEGVIDKFIKPFVLSEPPLLKVGIIKISEKKHILMCDLHHIICDGISLNVLIEEFASIYEGNILEPLKLQYKDYSEWENSNYVKDMMMEKEKYWINSLSGDLPILKMPIDFERPELQNFDGDRVSMTIDEKDYVSLKKLSSDKDATMFMVLLAVYNLVLSKYTCQEDIIVGIPSAGRGHSDLHNVIGMFVNSLPVRSYPQKEKNFAQFLEGVKTAVLSAFENQEYQYEKLIEKLDIKRNFSRNPLFDTMITMQKHDIGEMEFSDLVFSMYEFDSNISKFDFTLNVAEMENSIELTIEYSTKLFNRDTMVKFLENYIKAVGIITSNPLVKLGEVNIGVDSKRAYWIKKFSGNLVKSYFPYDILEDRVLEDREDKVCFKLPDNVYSNLIKICRGSNANLHAFFVCILDFLLFRITGNQDIVVGTPIYKQKVEGVYVNTVLPLRNSLSDEMTVKELLVEIRETLIEASENQNYSIDKLIYNLDIEKSQGGYPLFDSVVVLNGIHDRKYIDYTNPGTMFIINRQEGFIEVEIEYKASLYKKASVERIAEFYINAVKEFLQDVNTRLMDIDIISEEEKEKLLFGFNDTYVDNGKGVFIHKLFEEQVLKKPENTCIVFGESKLTYRELDNRANNLARILRQKGTVPNSIVAILTKRSLEMAVGILAILKAGGAYLPIDPTYPKDRMEYIVNDSNAKMLVTTSDLEHIAVNLTEEILFIDKQELLVDGCEGLDNVNKGTDTAYVIYTSGTTGQPKGVLISHKGAANTIKWRKDEYKLNSLDNVLQLFSYSFDGFVTSFFTPIVSGAQVIFLDDEGAKDPIKIKEAIKKNSITNFISVPTLYGAVLEILEEDELKSIKTVTLAGDRVLSKLISDTKLKAPWIEIANEYGPTECSVAATIERNLEPNSPITIGKPIRNTVILILDENNKLVPLGVPGEICIAGEGVAKGYINKEELTKEKFIDNPYSGYKVLYKTGDLAKWTKDGKLEFLGRADYQVKIRGYRIETGEIESRLLKNDKIKECVVTAIEDEKGHNFLCAYYVGEELTDQGLKEYLKIQMPEFMVPSYFVKMDKMPYTAVGKIDRKALPEPYKYAGNSDYIEPETETEKALALIWQDVLGIEKIGMEDRFFDLGGDSINAIQIASRTYKLGYKLDIVDLIKNPGIREICKNLKNVERQIFQGIVEGKVVTTPIVKWFFKNGFNNSHHFNQSFMVYSKKGFSEEIIKKVFDKLIEHHDALRMVVKEEDGEFVLYNDGIKENSFSFDVFDFKEKENLEESINFECEKIQGSMDLIKGPLVKLGLFKTNDGDHLLLALHHMVVDGVSWRIILEDLVSGYHLAMNGREIKYDLKTDSFKDWSYKLKEYALSEKLLSEITYWKEIESQDYKPLPKDKIAHTSLQKDETSVHISLENEDTKLLLHNVNSAFNTEINDILITALAMAVKDWTGENKVCINMEGHGREEIIDEININRTIGWFTSSYPVLLDVENQEDLSYNIKSIKEYIRKIPNKGIGYGILKYLTSDDKKQGVSFSIHPEITFNYLGQFQEETENELFEMSELPSGNQISPDMERFCNIDVNGVIADGQLNISVKYNKNEYFEETMISFVQRIKARLIDIINYCANKHEAESTPSDFENDSITIEELDCILDQIDDI